MPSSIFSIAAGAWMGAALMGFPTVATSMALGATMACLPLIVERKKEASGERTG